jgi:two-component system, OmpR family, clock-associated histidine kinase SasA
MDELLPQQPPKPTLSHPGGDAVLPDPLRVPQPDLAARISTRVSPMGQGSPTRQVFAREGAANAGLAAALPANPPVGGPVVIKLMLFINLRNHASALVQEIRATLAELQGNDQFELEITQVREHPQLAEHFKLVATPSLVKTHPLPAQVLTGSNVTEQVRYWWPRWIANAPRLQSEMPAQGALGLDVKGLDTEVSEYIFGIEDEAFRLRQEKISLQAQLKFRDRIISILAHDLRNPLMAASLAMETLDKGLRQEMPLPEGLDRQLVSQARGQLKILDSLVADMLQSDWGEERLTIEPHRCDLAEIKSTIIQQFEEQCIQKGQKLRVDIPLDLPPACADRERIRQVFANLLDNAIKYTPRGGEITISAFHRTSQKLEISICDTGPGIPVEEQARIFENTVRLERDHATPGYGIGLALCDRIIKGHYCRIWVDSRMPKGSCFRFTLPVFDE